MIFTLVAFWWCRSRVAAHRFDRADSWLGQADIYVVRIHVVINSMKRLDFLWVEGVDEDENDYIFIPEVNDQKEFDGGSVAILRRVIESWQ